VALPFALRAAGMQQPGNGTTAIVGATVIDGTGAAAMPNATVVIRDKRIAAVGPRDQVTVPSGAAVIDGAGKFVTPGALPRSKATSSWA